MDKLYTVKVELRVWNFGTQKFIGKSKCSVPLLVLSNAFRDPIATDIANGQFIYRFLMQCCTNRRPRSNESAENIGKTEWQSVLMAQQRCRRDPPWSRWPDYYSPMVAPKGPKTFIEIWTFISNSFTIYWVIASTGGTTYKGVGFTHGQGLLDLFAHSGAQRI